MVRVQAGMSGLSFSRGRGSIFTVIRGNGNVNVRIKQARKRFYGIGNEFLKYGLESVIVQDRSIPEIKSQYLSLGDD